MKSMQSKSGRPVWQDPRAVALLLAASLTTMANATISPALPGLAHLFAHDPNAAMLTRLLVPAPSLSVALCAPLVGLAADRFGRRRLLLAGVMLFVVAGCAGLFLPNLRAIFASRLVLGVAVALVMTAQTALIGDYFDGDDRKALTGLQIAARNFGGLVFISIAGLVAALSPRMPFAIYGFAILFLPLMWAVIVDAERPFQDRAAQAAEGAEGRPAWRMILSALVALQALTNMMFFLVPTQLPFFFDANGYDSAVMTSSALAVLMLTGGCCALLYRRIHRTIGYLGLFASGYAAMALGFGLLTVSASPWHALPGMAAIGAGYAMVTPSFVAIALDLAPVHRRGLAGGILTASVFIGQFCSPLLGTPAIALMGYQGAFGATALFLSAMVMTASLAGCVSRLRRSSRSWRGIRRTPVS